MNAGHPINTSIPHSSTNHTQRYQEQQTMAFNSILKKSPIFVNHNDSIFEPVSEPENTTKDYNSQTIIIPSHQPEHPVIQMQLSNYTRTTPQSQDPTQPLQLIRWTQRPKFATFFWEEEGTFCYRVDANNNCVARRQDNDMVNGTKLLNVTGMSRGKRDGILKNDKTRVVVKIGPIHLKGVWIPFQRAKELAREYGISETLNPLFLDDPNEYFQEIKRKLSVALDRSMEDTDTRNNNERSIDQNFRQTHEGT